MHDNALLKSESRANLKRSLLVWSAPPCATATRPHQDKGLRYRQRQHDDSLSGFWAWLP